MPTTEKTVFEGRPMQGATAERPVKPFGGFLYFDTTIGYLLYFDGVSEEWRPAGTPAGTTADRPSAEDVPTGARYFNEDIASLQYSDGVTWLTLVVDDEQSSSSSTSSNSSSSSDSTSSSESSSTESSDSSST